MNAPVEIAVQDQAGARAALAAGASRLELVAALVTGGLTPSIGFVEAAVEAAADAGLAGAVLPIIRPRPGGFVYDADDVAVVERDVRAAIAAGADGVVVGTLTADVRVDVDVLRRWIDAADGRPVTFHRAIDATPEPLAAVEALIGAGVSRVLTSGGAIRSIDGVAGIRALAELGAGRIEIVAGGGVRPVDIPALLAAGADSVHLSARRSILDPHAAGPGGGGGGEVDATDPAIVAEAVALARR